MKSLLTVLLALTTLSINATVIEMKLDSTPEYRHDKYDGDYNLISQNYLNTPSESFTNKLYIDLNSGIDPEENIFAGAEYTQHQTVANFTNYNFGLYSPFLDIFNPYITGDVNDNLGLLTLSDSYLDYSVFFNETSTPGFEGGDASIRFGQIFTYEGIEPTTGNITSDYLLLTGRLYLKSINSVQEYNAFKQFELKDVIALTDNAFVEWNTVISRRIKRNCDRACDSFISSDALFGSSYGVSSVSVPEPSSLLVFISGLMCMLRTKRKKSAQLV